MDPLLEQFLSEARESLAFIEQNIENLGDADSELLNSVFRAIHTLKGGSGIVGFDSIRDISHHAEDLLGMIRDDKLLFSDAMIETLYNAFDEVLNLVEATEESEDIVEADEDTLSKILNSLSEQMGQNTEFESNNEVEFSLVEDASSILNLPLKDIFKQTPYKVSFKQDKLNEEFYLNENFYAVVFDIDISSVIHKGDPIQVLSTLGDKVLGVYSCMSEENAKSVLSGIENEDGLLLKVQLIAFVKATYQEIQKALFDFMDELHFLALDIATLLSINVGEVGHQIESLKELNNITKNLELSDIIEEVQKSMALVGSDTLQHAQLQRFLDISNLIDANEISKLGGFFDNLYRGEVYEYDKNVQTISVKQPQIVQNIALQQLLALDYVQSEDDLKRVEFIMSKIKKFIPEMPAGLSSKEQIKSFIQSHFGVKQKDEMIEDDSKEDATQKEDFHKVVVGKTLKVDQESIDSLMNLVGELLVAKNSLPYLADNVVKMTHESIKKEIMDKYIFINRLSEQLQDLIIGMRMLPISYVFDRYPKLVRDISKKLGKKVTLEIEGADTRLDKNMIEMLADPLIHIMRNSLDHGIEMPDVREQKGKSSNANVTLKSFAQSDKIIIEVKDDGAGININKVVNKVLEKGLMTQEQIDAQSEEEMAELIFLPGLSTVDEVTEFSGRGVGMDVVKKSIESFGGSISIKTKANQGTLITLAIPISLAVTSLLHIQMNDIHYGLPMDSVSETLKIERSEIEYLNSEPFIYIRGDVIPLLFVKSMLNKEIDKDETLSIVVLNIKNNLLAVVVDRFLGQLDVVQKPLAGVMKDHPLFSATALLGNGQIIISIDPIGLLEISQKLKENIEVA